MFYPIGNIIQCLTYRKIHCLNCPSLIEPASATPIRLRFTEISVSCSYWFVICCSRSRKLAKGSAEEFQPNEGSWFKIARCVLLYYMSSTVSYSIEIVDTGWLPLVHIIMTFTNIKLDLSHYSTYVSGSGYVSFLIIINVLATPTSWST